jgi:uncharacterized protein
VTIIIDTSIIVALANVRENYHYWSKLQAADLSYPFYTCEPVLSESFHLLQTIPKGTDTLLGFLDKGLVKVSFHYINHSAPIHKFLRKYADLPASFADACLVGMAEATKKSRIFTLDKDFTIYRTSKGKALSLISPL